MVVAYGFANETAIGPSIADAHMDSEVAAPDSSQWEY